MFKLLIAVDGSGHAHRAIDAVAKLAQSSVELEAVLLHVSPEPIFYGDYSANTIQSIQEGQLIRQNKVLKEATNYALARGLTISKSHRDSGVGHEQRRQHASWLGGAACGSPRISTRVAGEVT